MAYTSYTAGVNNASDAAFRAWCSAIHAAILAGGFVNTADTGQIDLTTVVKPAAIGTSAGYKIYQSQDAGAGQNNYYIKIEFGSGSTNAAQSSIWITVGWATDGAGNLVSTTYPISTRTNLTSINAGTGTPLYLAAGTGANGAGYIAITLAQASSITFGFSVERTRNSDLTFKDQILVVGMSSANFPAYVQVIDRSNAFPAVSGSPAANATTIAPMANTPSSGVAALGLVFGYAPGCTSPSMCWFGCEQNGIGVLGNRVSITINGVAHYYVLNDQSANVQFGGLVSTAIMSRWE
jgi:hypothetical protein